MRPLPASSSLRAFAASVLTLTAAMLASPGLAAAHGGDSGGQQLPNAVRPVTPDGSRAVDILSRLEKDTVAAAIVREPIGKAKRALQRADGANAAGDAEGSRLLSSLALAHATNAEATLRAVDAEKKSSAAQTKNADLHDKLVRTRTLLAETQAQRGQIAAELARAEEEARANAARADAKEDERVQKGAKKDEGGDGKKKKPKAGDAPPKKDGEKKDGASKDAPKKAEPKKGAGK